MAGQKEKRRSKLKGDLNTHEQAGKCRRASKSKTGFQKRKKKTGREDGRESRGPRSLGQADGIASTKQALIEARGTQYRVPPTEVTEPCLKGTRNWDNYDMGWTSSRRWTSGS